MPAGASTDSLQQPSNGNATAPTYNRQSQAPFPTETPSWLRKKPLWVVMKEIEQSHGHDDNNNSNHIQRHLSLIDLISVGVGGTIGSGIFVLAGFIGKRIFLLLFLRLFII